MSDTEVSTESGSCPGSCHATTTVSTDSIVASLATPVTYALIRVSVVEVFIFYVYHNIVSMLMLFIQKCQQAPIVLHQPVTPMIFTAHICQSPTLGGLLLSECLELEVKGDRLLLELRLPCCLNSSTFRIMSFRPVLASTFIPSMLMLILPSVLPVNSLSSSRNFIARQT